MSKDIYTLKLHEETNIGGNLNALRVPGGWIYCWTKSGEPAVFVPFHNEFMDSQQPPEHLEPKPAKPIRCCFRAGCPETTGIPGDDRWLCDNHKPPPQPDIRLCEVAGCGEIATTPAALCTDCMDEMGGKR